MVLKTAGAVSAVAGAARPAYASVEVNGTEFTWDGNIADTSARRRVDSGPMANDVPTAPADFLDRERSQTDSTATTPCFLVSD